MKSYAIGLSTALLLLPTISLAQGGSAGDGVSFILNGHVWKDKRAFVESGARCATVHPDSAMRYEIEKALRGFNERLAASGKTSGGPVSRAPGSVTVPVYFHVINKGTGIANGDVPSTMIDAQLNVLNEAYSGASGGADTVFRFTLAGIDRTTNSSWYTMSMGSREERQAKAALRRGGPTPLIFIQQTFLAECWAGPLFLGAMRGIPAMMG